MYPHFTIPNFLSREECESVLNICNNTLELKNALVGNNNLDLKTRESSIAFINDLGFVNNRLQTTLMNSVSVNGFNVSGLQYFQFTKYNKNGHYDWHTDAHGIYKDRFYSIVIQLNNEYGGGELQIMIEGEEITLERGLGTLYMFPSNMTHRVKPIINGVRYSLVNWVLLEKNKTYNTSLI